MIVLTIDRTLKKILVSLIHAMGYDFNTFKDEITKKYKKEGDERSGKEYLKKLKSPKVTWKTYLQTLKGLNLTDRDEVMIGLEHALPIGVNKWGEPNTIWFRFTNFDHTISDLAPSELSLFLEEILRQSGVSQPIYVNRIIEWLGDNNAPLDVSTLRIKAGGFIKKVGGDNITWTTFLDAMSALGIKNAKFLVKITKDNEEPILITNNLMGEE